MIFNSTHFCHAWLAIRHDNVFAGPGFALCSLHNIFYGNSIISLHFRWFVFYCASLCFTNINSFLIPAFRISLLVLSSKLGKLKSELLTESNKLEAKIDFSTNIIRTQVSRKTKFPVHRRVSKVQSNAKSPISPQMGCPLDINHYIFVQFTD